MAGVYEALELRDKDASVHMGKGVLKVCACDAPCPVRLHGA